MYDETTAVSSRISVNILFLVKSALSRETLATTREYVPRKALSLIVDGKQFITIKFQ